jgi:chromosome segregation protein
LRQRELELESLQKDKEFCLVHRREVLSLHETWKQKETHLRDAFNMVESHEKLDQERLLFLDEGKRRLVDRDGELRQEEEQCVQLRSVLERELQEISVEIEMIRKDKNEQEQRLAHMRREIEQCSIEIKTIQDRQHGLEMRIKDFDFEEKSFIERLEQKYRMVFSETPAPAEMPHTDLAALDEKISELQKRVDQLGTVNLLAIEEYEDLKQRFDFLAGQKKDLEDSREQLLEAIRKINRTTKQLFEDTFQNVQKQFGEYYKILFSGGEAKLILLDEQHPLDSGVDIVVRPPGKKLQHISLLSGGEKALTAVALIFALFSIKPSPFCLLDEVDAPLDEANVDRFLKVTQSFIKLSQFIIITHNRKTISMGNALYGVTMQEAGVSKIVSVRVANELPDLTPAKKSSSAGTVPV